MVVKGESKPFNTKVSGHLTALLERVGCTGMNTVWHGDLAFAQCVCVDGRFSHVVQSGLGHGE